MKFTNRFNIDIGLEEAKKRFVNRAYNRVFYNFYLNLQDDRRYYTHKEIASVLGKKYSYRHNLENLIGEEFLDNLLALETFYHSVDSYNQNKVDRLIRLLLAESEVDLGVIWDGNKFIKSGAQLLDDKLVNDPLKWLRDQKYYSVITPFEKGLDHFLHSDKRPELLADVITDMYEAIEALSKIVSSRPNKDLSANKEVFISKIKASSKYKEFMTTYIEYANEFRHAKEEGKINLIYHKTR